jgi:uroporphyrinogen-III synthase
MQRKILYLGLEMPAHLAEKALHCPIISVVPRDPTECLTLFPPCTHLVVTSKSSVRILQNLGLDLRSKVTIAVGQQTANLLPVAHHVAAEECAEGVVALLRGLDLREAQLFWPHAAKARSVISDYCREAGVRLSECILYDTVVRMPHPLPDLSIFEEIVFTSPSCVDAFIEIFGPLPREKRLTAIGPVTQMRLLAI